MNYGLYLSAAGLLTNSYRQDVYANNLANVETVGFKRDIPTIRQRLPEAAENPGGAEYGQKLLDMLGGGSLAGPQRIVFDPAPLKAGGKLDVALETAKTFFAVSAKEGNGQYATRLTRDGRFIVDSQGYLVMASGGARVLDTGDRPIQLTGTGPIDIDPAGRVHQGGEVAGQIQVTSVSSTDKLYKRGQSLFGWNGGDIRKAAADTTIRPGFVETSGVEPMQALLDVMEATKATTANGNLIRYQDTMMERAVNSLARVA